jgi:hypothetical protein
MTTREILIARMGVYQTKLNGIDEFLKNNLPEIDYISLERKARFERKHYSEEIQLITKNLIDLENGTNK